MVAVLPPVRVRGQDTWRADTYIIRSSACCDVSAISKPLTLSSPILTATFASVVMRPFVHPEPWQTAPIVWTEPDPDSPEAFNEDEFVALWNEWFSLLLKIRHIRRDQVIFPPQDTGRHSNLHTDRLYGDLGMSPEAVSLVERLPYLIDGDDWHILPEAIGLSYLRPDHLDQCRDPHDMAQFSTGVSHDPPSSTDGIYMLPHDVALTMPYEGEGMTWILDLKYSAWLS